MHTYMLWGFTCVRLPNTRACTQLTQTRVLLDAVIFTHAATTRYNEAYAELVGGSTNSAGKQRAQPWRLADEFLNRLNDIELFPSGHRVDESLLQRFQQIEVGWWVWRIKRGLPVAVSYCILAERAWWIRSGVAVSSPPLCVCVPCRVHPGVALRTLRGRRRLVQSHPVGVVLQRMSRLHGYSSTELCVAPQRSAEPCKAPRASAVQR